MLADLAMLTGLAASVSPGHWSTMAGLENQRTSRRQLAALGLAALGLCGCGTGQGSAESALLEDRVVSPRATPTPVALDGLDESSRAALARAPFPVLLFPASYGAQEVITADGEPWAAVNAHRDGMHLSLHGTSREHPVLSDEEVANLPPARTFVRGSPAWVTLNEQIRSAAWHEGAVAWSLEIECDRPFEDARCTEEDFVLRLAETLERVEPGRLATSGGAR